MEWLLFAIMAGFDVLALYVPGMLIIRASRMPWVASILLAPLASIAAYTVLAIVYCWIGIPCNWATLALALTIVGVIALAVSCGIVREGAKAGGDAILRDSSEDNRFSWCCLALYSIVGIVITIIVFASCFDVPSTFIQTFDNAAHLNMIQSFVDSGNYSTLATTVFPEVEANEFVNPWKAYYPAAWHGLAAMAYSAFGGSAAIAENALLFALSGVVYPLSMLALLLRLFGDNKMILIAGSLLVLGFAAFPWRFLTFGPLFSNLLAYAILPLIVTAFMSIFQEKVQAKKRITFGAIFCLGLICVVSTQPNSLFAMAVFLIPYCFVQILRLTDFIAKQKGNRVVIRVILSIAYLFAVCVIWYAFYSASFMQGIVQYPHESGLPPLTAVKHVADLNTALMGPQLALALLVVLGIVFTIWRRRRIIWVVASYLLFAVIYIACVSAGEFFQHLLAGFWYSDFYRIAACLAIFGLPIACMGIECIVDFAMAMHEKFRKEQPSPALEKVAFAAVCVLFLFFNFGSMVIRPLGVIGGNFENTRDVIRDLYANDSSQSLNEEEKQFVDQVIATIPEGSRVLNMPYDGSVFAYGYNGLDTYFREYNISGMAANDKSSGIVRMRTKDVASDGEVADVLRSSDVDYVLLLDYEEGKEATLNPFSYDPSVWAGINDIRDDMPGFELVMSEGDMRLYKVVD